MSTESDFFRETVPRVVGEQFTRNAALSVCAALKDARHWPDFELDATPTLRRVNFMSGLGFATWGRGISVNKVGHQGGSHVEVSGRGFILSSVTRARMPNKVAPHEYRKTLARISQMHLWERNEPTEFGFLYGLAIFGGHFKARLPSFCRIAFPTPDGQLAPGTIDLLAEYKHIVEPFKDVEYREREVARFIALREADQG